MRALLVGGGLLVGAAAWAQDAPPPLSYSPTHYLLQALLSLVVVVGLIFGVYWLLRKVGPGRLAAPVAGPAELLQSVPLPGGYTLHVVRVGPRLLAVTCGPGGVSTAEVGESDEVGEGGP